MKKKKLIAVLITFSLFWTITAQESEPVAEIDLEPPTPTTKETPPAETANAMSSENTASEAKEERVLESDLEPPAQQNTLETTKKSQENQAENITAKNDEESKTSASDLSVSSDKQVSGDSAVSDNLEEKIDLPENALAELPENESENTENEEQKQVVEKSAAEQDPNYATRYPFLAAFADRPEVVEIRNDYLSPKRTALLYAILENAMEYRLYVRKTVSERELPGELEYLPVVESGYKTAAKSKSGATGMWQFMENSVKPFLKLTDYVDERLDPWKSTDAGLSKLQDNYKYFNDWLLAIAAYNCGAGAMNKAIRRGESRDFWYLAENGFISSQTVEYVPKLIAIADLAVNSEKYGIDLPSHDEEYEVLENERDAIFDYIEVEKAYSISAIAREMRIDESTLKRLNPSLIKGFTPPATKYEIRFPLGTLETAQKAIESINPIEFPFKYKVVSGDSLWSISRRYGVTVQMLCEANGIEENAILKIGKILYIPSK